MHIFYSEYKTDYSSYTFSYAIYCVKEKQEELADIYQKGFLPYTGDPSLQQDTFYLARSLRVNLENFSSSSENRRVDRKIQPLEISMEVSAIHDFDIRDPAFRQFCLSFAEERFSGGSLSEERLSYILSRKMLTHVFSFRRGDKIYGYVLAVLQGGMLHYWFSFFDTAYLRSHSLGKWMMWKVINWAKKEGLDQVYIGTCYREKSLYKVRDHKGAAFFDGQKWNDDIRLLKELCRSDDEEKEKDLFKSRGEIYQKPGM
jgi:arginine-tRNA-protein transferase